MFSIIIRLPGHIAKLIGMPNYSRHVGQGEARNGQVHDYLSNHVGSSKIFTP